MPDTRYAHRTRVTIGGDRDEEPRAACAENPAPYDYLIDYSGGSTWRYALEEARKICSTCSLWRACLAENADEEWARAIIANQSRNSPTRSVA